MSKVMKMLAIVIMAAVLVATLSTTVYASAGQGQTSLENSLSLSQFAGKGDNSGAGTATTNIIGALITVIQIIGTGVAIIMLLVLAIKYISASPGDKAEIKKNAVVYVVGAIVLFAATGILQIVKSFAEGNINNAVSAT